MPLSDAAARTAKPKAKPYKLTDAEADRLHGAAQMFRQSGYRIDAKEVPAINVYKSVL